MIELFQSRKSSIETNYIAHVKVKADLLPGLNYCPYEKCAARQVPDPKLLTYSDLDTKTIIPNNHFYAFAHLHTHFVDGSS